MLHCTTSSKVIKIIRDKEPTYLSDKLSVQYYKEPQRPRLGNFCEASTTGVGHQSIENCLDFTW